MEGFILLARNYPVAMTGMVCFYRSVVNGLNKVAESVAVGGLSFWSCYQASFGIQYGRRINMRSDWEIRYRDQIR